MFQDPRRIVETQPPDVLHDSRPVHLCDEWQERPLNQLVPSLAKISTVGLTDEREDAVRTPATNEPLVLRDGAPTRFTPGGIRGGSRLRCRAPEFSELPAGLSELGNELLVGLLFVPHADLSKSP
jgi:hypothetical protein